MLRIETLVINQTSSHKVFLSVSGHSFTPFKEVAIKIYFCWILGQQRYFMAHPVGATTQNLGLSASIHRHRGCLSMSLL